jgi:hypothetical protein
VLIVVILVVIPSLERDPKERGTTETVTEAKTERKTEQATEAVEIIQTEPPEEVKRAELARLERKKTEQATEHTTGEVNADGYGWIELKYSATYHITENHLTKENGVVYYAGHRETWYSIHEPGQTVTAWDIPGKHIADDGTIRDEDGFICIASSDHEAHTVIMTSVGIGKVYDTGCSHGTVDVYTAW